MFPSGLQERLALVRLELKWFLYYPASLRPSVVDSRSQGCQPSREYDCDVKTNRFEKHSGLGGSFHVRFWAGSPVECFRDFQPR